MRKLAIALALVSIVSCSGRVTSSAVPEADDSQIQRVEPLRWWVGMKTNLQLLVQGPGISAYDVSVQESGLRVKAVHKADSPDYLFVDLDISAKAAPGTYHLVFSKEGESFSYPYLIQERRPGSASRESFTASDMIYLIMPDRFARGDSLARPYADGSLRQWKSPLLLDKVDRKDPNARHGGNLQGIADHLDYIADLGATAIWLTPVLINGMPRGSYHGYACTDYYHVDPRFGDNEQYRELVQACHQKGLKVILDVVTNHCGTGHWWMDNPPFKDWYHVHEPYMQMNALSSVFMDPYVAKTDMDRQVSGWFVPSMPDMNLDNPFVLKYFQQWAVWWTEYADLDGLRVDTYPYNEPEPMAQWCKAVTDEYPAFNIVGETWDYSIPQVAYWQKDNPNKNGYNSNLPSVMDFPLEQAIHTALMEDKVNWFEGMTRIYGIIAQDFVYNDPSHLLVFFANHDHDRTGDTFKEDPSRMKLALALLATVRGIPQLYYGDEMMFLCRKDVPVSDGAKRIDFPGGWTSDEFTLFTAAGRASAPAMYAHAADLHDYARTLFRWRRGCKAVHEGKTLHFLSRKNVGPVNRTENSYSFFRYTDDDAVFVFINNSLEPCTLDWDHYAEFVSGPVTGTDVLSGEEIVLRNGLSIGPKSALIVEFIPGAQRVDNK